MKVSKLVLLGSLFGGIVPALAQTPTPAWNTPALRAAEASIRAENIRAHVKFLSDDLLEGREPLLRLRHAITNTNYYVRVFAARGPRDRTLRKSVPIAEGVLHWVRTSRLGSEPLTGLARKSLQRLDVMEVRAVRIDAQADLPDEVHLPRPAGAADEWNDDDFDEL